MFECAQAFTISYYELTTLYSLYFVILYVGILRTTTMRVLHVLLIELSKYAPTTKYKKYN